MAPDDTISSLSSVVSSYAIDQLASVPRLKAILSWTSQTPVILSASASKMRASMVSSLVASTASRPLSVPVPVNVRVSVFSTSPVAIIMLLPVELIVRSPVLSTVNPV